MSCVIILGYKAASVAALLEEQWRTELVWVLYPVIQVGWRNHTSTKGQVGGRHAGPTQLIEDLEVVSLLFLTEILFHGFIGETSSVCEV